MKHAFWRSLFSLATMGFLIPISTHAQVTSDGTTSTSINQEGNNFTIEQGDRAGDNLFHSFDEFSVPIQGSAAFNNAADIANIFSRVTGSNISNIDGLLSANGAANLYLINPNGIIFGANASLDLGGSFFASTADSLLFEGGEEFSASNPQAAPLLEVSIPVGLSFRDNPGDIVNRSNVENDAEEVIGLEIFPGNNISFLSGNINFEGGNLTASGGDVQLVAVSESGAVGIGEDGSLKLVEDISRGDITLSEAQAGNITINIAEDISLNDSVINNQVSPRSSGNSGDITINTASLELVNGGGVLTATSGQGNAGNVNISTTEDITINGQGSAGSITSIGSLVFADGVGNSGDLSISTTNLNLNNGGRINALIFGQGNIGAINIIATEDINIDGQDALSFLPLLASVVTPTGVGDSEGISISTSNLNLTNGGRIGADIAGQGDGGEVNITATDNITIDGEDSEQSTSGIVNRISTTGVGNSEGVTISTTNLNLTNGGTIDASTFGEGNAGAVNISTTGDITLDGENSEDFPSSITNEVGSDGVGDSGGVTISTTNLNLTNGGIVNGGTDGQGNAEAVNIIATDNITIDGRGLSDSSTGIANQVRSNAVGNSGGITISTTNLNLTNGGNIDTNTFGQVNNTEGVTISTANLSLTRGAQISSNTFVSI